MQHTMQTGPSQNSLNGENLLEQLYDIYDFMYIPLWDRPWVQWSFAFVILLLATVCAYGIYRWYMHKKKSAWEVAIKALGHLKADPLNAQFFYEQLTMIGKKYIEKIKHISFQDKTDQELLEYLRQIVPVVMHDPLEKMVDHATVIKFADQPANSTAMNQDRACMIDMIESLRPSDQIK